MFFIREWQWHIEKSLKWCSTKGNQGFPIETMENENNEVLELLDMCNNPI